MTERPAPLPTAKVIRVLVSAAARRWLNRISGQFGRAFRRKQAEAGRTATARKHQPSRIGAVVILALFLFVGLSVSAGIVRNLAAAISDGSDSRIVVDRVTFRRIVRAEAAMRGEDTDVTNDDAERARYKQRHRTKLARALSEDVLDREVSDDDFPLRSLAPDQRIGVERTLDVFDARGSEGFRSEADIDWLGDYSWAAGSVQFRTLVALVLGLTFFAMLVMSLGNANTDLGHVDWTVQWLFTFPVRARSLFLARILEYTLLNPASWVLHAPLVFVVLWSQRAGAWAIPIAIGATLFINVLLALSRLLLETWLRKRLSLQQLKTVQATCTAVGLVALLAVYALSYIRLPFSLTPLAAAPAAIAWLPWALPSTLIAGDATSAAGAAIMVIGAIVLVAAGVRLAEHLVRDGLLVGAGGYRGQRGGRRAEPAGSRRWFNGIVGRELMLLRRDRNLFVQTFIVPVAVIGFQLVISPQLFAGATSDPAHASALAFGIGAYVLMGGGFMALSNEGKALWLLFTFPQRIEQVLLRKAVVWGAVATMYTLAVIVAVAALGGGLDIDGVVGSIMALVGVAIYAAIAVGMGILGTDPLAEEVQRKVRPTVLFTYMLLAGLFGYGFYAPIWTKLVLVIVSALLAVAIWQIVRDRVPLLLDPVQRPAPRIALSDGLIAVLGFIVLQSLMSLAMLKAGVPAIQAIVVAFVAAGAVVTLIALYIFWARKVPNIFATVGIRAPHDGASVIGSSLRGIVLGAGAGSIAVLYQQLVLDTASVPFSPTLAVLAIVAAPLFEEFIFRGLVFRGLRRSTHAAVAILASAAIFAIVHPPISFVPVFGLGIATALSFERSGRLIAPILTHAVYNAMVVIAASR